jgi:hypothetical protein
LEVVKLGFKGIKSGGKLSPIDCSRDQLRGRLGSHRAIAIIHESIPPTEAANTTEVVHSSMCLLQLFNPAFYLADAFINQLEALVNFLSACI